MSASPSKQRKSMILRSSKRARLLVFDVSRRYLFETLPIDVTAIIARAVCIRSDSEEDALLVLLQVGGTLAVGAKFEYDSWTEISERDSVRIRRNSDLTKFGLSMRTRGATPRTKEQRS